MRLRLTSPAISPAINTFRNFVPQGTSRARQILGTRWTRSKALLGSQTYCNLKSGSFHLLSKSRSLLNMATRILSISGVTLCCVVESFLLSRKPPKYVSDSDGFVKLFFTLLPLHYLMLVIFWGLIYPFFVSPLKHFPAPKVSLDTS